MYKKLSLLSIKPKTSKLTILIILFLSLIFIISYRLKTYSTYKTLAIIRCEEECYIETSIPSTKSSIIDKELELEYENRKYKVNKTYIEDIIEENNQIYLRLRIDSDLDLEKNNIINIKILYDKQRITSKIKNIMKG